MGFLFAGPSLREAALGGWSVICEAEWVFSLLVRGHVRPHYNMANLGYANILSSNTRYRAYGTVK